MKIEKMTDAHLDLVSTIEQNTFSHPWSLKSLTDELHNNTSHYFVCIEDDTVIGYIGMSAVVDEGYIFNVAVDKNYRRRGAGSMLVNHLVTYGKKNNLCFLTLEVRESNSSAQSLYSNFGFVKAGERKNYYSSPVENAVLMTKYF